MPKKNRIITNRSFQIAIILVTVLIISLVFTKFLNILEFLTGYGFIFKLFIFFLTFSTLFYFFYSKFFILPLKEIMISSQGRKNKVLFWILSIIICISMLLLLMPFSWWTKLV